MDYKTDRVRFGKVGVDELKKHYKIQLDYYGKVVEQITENFIDLCKLRI